MQDQAVFNVAAVGDLDRFACLFQYPIEAWVDIPAARKHVFSGRRLSLIEKLDMRRYKRDLLKVSGLLLEDQDFPALVIDIAPLQPDDFTVPGRRQHCKL